MLVAAGGVGAVLSLATVHLSVLALAQIYAVPLADDAGHAVADAAFLYLAVLLLSSVAVVTSLALAAGGYWLSSRSRSALAERVDAAPRRALSGLGLVLVVPSVAAYAGTAVLGRSAFWSVAAVAAASYVGGLLLLAGAVRRRGGRG